LISKDENILAYKYLVGSDACHVSVDVLDPTSRQIDIASTIINYGCKVWLYLNDNVSIGHPRIGWTLVNLKEILN
jgi:hypothetical protein